MEDDGDDDHYEEEILDQPDDADLDEAVQVDSFSTSRNFFLIIF
jgi:DNA-directed RNA polymerases I, II, and III subunit RPABC2